MQQQLAAAKQHELSPVFAPLTMASLFESLEQLWSEHPIARGRHLSFHCPQPNHQFSTDATLLSRVMGNLIKNACEASAKGEEIRIVAIVNPVEQQILIAVSNRGVIPNEIRPQLFQQGTSSKGKGRGIGTYSARLFCEDYLHGEISFTSTAEQGTTFMVTLPQAPPDES